MAEHVLDPATAEWIENLYRIEVTDPVLGGQAGPLNAAALGLDARTRLLKAAVEGMNLQVVLSIGASANGSKITSLGAPSDPNDAVRKTDLDTAVAGVPSPLREYWLAPPICLNATGTDNTPLAAFGAGASWRAYQPATHWRWAVAVPASYQYIGFEITPWLPVGAVLTRVGAVLDADYGGASHGSVPTNKPKVGLWKRSLAVGGAGAAAWAAAGTDVTDPSASVAAYNLAHLVEQEINETIVAGTLYAIAVATEYGSGAVVDSPCITGFKFVVGAAS